tara:strand:- start:276 stop:488 length:213 start_codon:yes stop_codon:yes gene_type:complete
MHDTELRDDLLKSVAEIASYIGENTRRTNYLLDQQLLPGFKIGARWYARKSALDARFSEKRHPLAKLAKV